MRSLRQGAAVRQQRLAREQPHAPPLRPQPSVHTSPAPAGRDGSHEGLHDLYQGWQDREGCLNFKTFQSTQAAGASSTETDAPAFRLPFRVRPTQAASLSERAEARVNVRTHSSPASAITSISTRASRGRRAACTVERAGGVSLKKR